MNGKENTSDTVQCPAECPAPAPHLHPPHPGTRTPVARTPAPPDNLGTADCQNTVNSGNEIVYLE